MALVKNKGSDRDVACRKSHSKVEMRPDLCFHVVPGFCEPLMVQEDYEQSGLSRVKGQPISVSFQGDRKCGGTASLSPSLILLRELG